MMVCDQTCPERLKEKHKNKMTQTILFIINLLGLEIGTLSHAIIKMIRALWGDRIIKKTELDVK